MNTTYTYIKEIIQELEERLSAELNGIITQLSTEEIPLTSVTNEIQVGRFKPEGYSVYPLISIVPDIVKPEYSTVSYTGYQSTLDANIMIVIRQGTTDAKLAFYQLANYIKAIIIFINSHKTEYELSEEGIEMYESLGADMSKLWASIAIRINFETITN